MADETGKKHPAKHLEHLTWKPGQTGNPAGRPRGARSKFSEAFCQDILDEWMAGGKEAIKQVRENDPATFLRVAASLIPKDININDTREASFDRFIEGLNDEQLNQLVAGLCTIGAQKDRTPTQEKAAGIEPDRVH